MSRLAKKKRDGSSGLWKRKADAAWGRIIHLVGGGKCAVGGDCAGNLEAHHIISRGVIATRHDPLNGVLLCSKHHKFSPLCSPHGGPAGFFAWFEKKFPGRIDLLHSSARPAGSLKPDYKRNCEILEQGYVEAEKFLKEATNAATGPA